MDQDTDPGFPFFQARAIGIVGFVQDLLGGWLAAGVADYKLQSLTRMALS
jgi:hypothetical protein